MLAPPISLSEIAGVFVPQLRLMLAPPISLSEIAGVFGPQLIRLPQQIRISRYQRLPIFALWSRQESSLPQVGHCVNCHLCWLLSCLNVVFYCRVRWR